MTSPVTPASVSLQQPNILVDASVWASILMSTDSNHAVSLAWWQRFTGHGGAIYAPSLLLVEVAAALARQTRQPAMAQRAVTYLQQTSQVQYIDMDSALVLDAADLAARLFIRGADAVYVAAAQQKAFPLVIWDNEQLARATVLRETFTPSTSPF